MIRLGTRIIKHGGIGMLLCLIIFIISKNALFLLPEPQQLKDFSTIDLKQELTKPYKLTTNDIKSFQKNGFVKLKNVLTPDVTQVLRYEGFCHF